MDITGFDFDTSLKILNPVLSLYMAIDTMSIGQSIMESNIRTVTQAIHNHLLDVQINQSTISHQPSHTNPKSVLSKFDKSKQHIGLEIHYLKDENGNCIIAEN